MSGTAIPSNSRGGQHLSALIVHGGCGNVTPEQEASKNHGARQAADAGLSVLHQGGSAVDAVAAAVRALEDNPVFNAGTGSVLTLYGDVEMDASLMRSDLECGAVAAVRGIRHPIDLARSVMEVTDHVLLVGAGAEHFAQILGVESYDPVTPERRARWKEVRALMEAGDLSADELEHWKRISQYAARYLGAEEKLYSTVGAVAVDDQGALAAGTSTGGIWFKLPGRVGDTPIIGAGTYATEHGAVSSTGHGEGIIKLCLAQRAVSYMREGTAREAVARAVEEATGHGVECGLIGVDARGGVGFAFNTPAMPTAQG